VKAAEWGRLPPTARSSAPSALAPDRIGWRRSVPALQRFVAVASVLLRFVLLFPRIRRLNVSAVTAGLAASHNSRRYHSLLSAASAVDHRLPDGNAQQAKPVPGLTGTPRSPAGGGSLHPSAHRCLRHRNPSTPLPVASPPGVKGAHAPARRSSSGEMNTCIREPATYCWTPDNRADVVPLVMRSQKTAGVSAAPATNAYPSLGSRPNLVCLLRLSHLRCESHACRC
jgi:hypothetical protein